MRRGYEIISKLSENERNQVFLVQDDTIGKRWVMKITARRKEMEESRSAGGEMQFLKKINHRGIVNVVDYWEEEAGSCLVMEYVEGIPLKQLIKQPGAIEERQALQWITELAGILEYLHGMEPPIFYLDLKPDNMIVCPDGHIKLIDFDAAVCAKDAPPRWDVHKACRMGTYGYAAPEQCRAVRGQEPDERSDIYGLGMTLYAMTTGLDPSLPPYGIRSREQWSHMVSRQLAVVILRCTQEEPKNRYPGVKALLRELKCLNGEEKPEKIKWAIGQKRRTLLQKKSLFLSDKHFAGWFAVFLLFCGLWLFTITGSAAEDKGGAEPLFLTLRNRAGQKILLQEGAVWETEGNLKIEIPEDSLYDRSRIFIEVWNETGAESRSRELKIIRKSH